MSAGLVFKDGGQSLLISLTGNVARSFQTPGGVDPEITQVAAPVLGSLVEGANVLAAFSPGVYSSNVGTIAPETHITTIAYKNGVASDPDVAAVADDVWQFLQSVTDSASTPAVEFLTTQRTVQAAPVDPGEYVMEWNEDWTAASPASQASYAEISGVQFDFDRVVNAYVFESHPDQHDIWIEATGGISIVATTPESVIVTRRGWGVMKNAVTRPGQGFDEAAEVTTKTGVVPYDAELNIAPSANAGAPIVLTAEEVARGVTLTMAVRRVAGGSWQPFDRYVSFHFGPHPLPLQAIPPSISAINKRLRTKADLQWGAVRNVDMSSYYSPNPETIFNRCAHNIGVFGNGGNHRRVMRLDLGISDSNYSAAVLGPYCEMLMLLHRADVSQAMKEAVAMRVVTYGEQILAVKKRGGNIVNNAGQGGNMGMHLYYAAALLGDAEMWEEAKNTGFQIQNDRVQWFAETDIGKAAPGRSKENVSAQTVLQESLDVPFVVSDEFGTNWDTRYDPIAGGILAWELLMISLLTGPGGENGAVAVLNGAPANSTSHQRSAAIALLDRYRTWRPWSGAWELPSYWRAWYDNLRDLCGVPRWTGKPDQIHQEWANFAGIDGGVSWNLPASWNYATLPKTRYDARVSLDGTQWVEYPDVPPQGQVTGLRRTLHYCGLRAWSDDLVGPWSPNYPREHAINDVSLQRNKATPIGTEPPAAVSYAGGVLPSVHAQMYPKWRSRNAGAWEPVSGVLPRDRITLKAGLGYPSQASPLPDYSFQWQVNGIDVEGATEQTYDRRKADADLPIRFKMIADNGVGSPVEITSEAVTAPSIIEPTEGWLVETDFDLSFKVDYEDEFEGITTSSGASRALDGSFTFGIAPHPTVEEGEDPPWQIDVTPGALIMVKTNTYPSLTIPLSRKPVPGQKYRITFHIGGTEANTLNTNRIWRARLQTQQSSGRLLIFYLNNGTNTLRRFTGIADVTEGIATGHIKQVWEGASTQFIAEGVFEFTYPLNGPDDFLTFIISHNSNTGGSGGGGNLVLSRLWLEPIDP